MATHEYAQHPQQGLDEALMEKGRFFFAYANVCFFLMFVAIFTIPVFFFFKDPLIAEYTVRATYFAFWISFISGAVFVICKNRIPAILFLALAVAFLIGIFSPDPISNFLFNKQ